MAPEASAFLHKLAELPIGYSAGFFNSTRYGATIKASPDRKRIWLFAEELGGRNRISFNLYRLRNSEYRLKPCEMPEERVINFVMGYIPDADTRDGDPERTRFE